MMKLKWVSVLCAAVFSLSSAAADRESYQDWWWNPAQSGMGVNVAQQGDHLVASWYHFQQDGRGVYLMLSGALKNNALTADLVRASGPVPGAGYDPSQVTRETVGTGTLRFLPDGQAELTYRFDNQSGTLTLERYVYTPQLEIAGTVAGVAEHTVAGICDPGYTPSAYPGALPEDQLAHVTFSEGEMSRKNAGYQFDMVSAASDSQNVSVFSFSSWSCTASLSFIQSSSNVAGEGMLQCKKLNGQSVEYTAPLKVNRVSTQGSGGMAIEYTAVHTRPAKDGYPKTDCEEKGRILLRKQI